MRYIVFSLLFIILILALAASGCSGGNAKEMFETAQFEELQMNDEHAEQLYRKIIDKYPESDYALLAEKRLLELKKQN